MRQSLEECKAIGSWFADCMVYKLSLNLNKKHWREVSNEYLLGRLKEEVQELEEAIKSGSDEDIIHESADVGNIAMMIADKHYNNRINQATQTRGEGVLNEL